MPATLTKADYEEIAKLFVGQMTPLLDEREAELKTSVSGQFDSAIQRHIDAVNARISEVETKGKKLGGSEAEIKAGFASLNGQDAEEKQQRVDAALTFIRKGYLRMQKSQRDLLRIGNGEDIEGLQTKAIELAAEMKSFSITDDTLGGYFILPDVIQNEIVKASVLFSPVRSLAKVQQTSNNVVDLPIRKSTLTAGWVAETGSRTETTGQSYGRASIATAEMYALVLFSRQLLEDAFYNLQDELQADIAEQFGVLEGAAFVNGDALNGKPQGFLANIPAGNVVTAAGASAIVYADMVKVFHKLKPAYRNSPNCQWVFNQNTLSAIRQIVDSNGRPIFQAFAESGLSAANPNTIMGKPYVEATDMPDIATGIRDVAVGDFSKAYRFIDRVGLTVQRLEEIYAASGQVGLLVHKRVGGQLVLGEAIAALKQA